MLSYQLQGVEEVLGRLGRLASLSGLEGELEAGADTILTDVRVEPPERPGQRYVRSHRLSGSWRRTNARRSGGAVVLDIENPTEYAPFVQGEEQAAIHRGRWKRLKVVGEEKLPAIRARAQAWATKTWRGA